MYDLYIKYPYADIDRVSTVLSSPLQDMHVSFFSKAIEATLCLGYCIWGQWIIEWL